MITADKKKFRNQAHPLKPVVMLGQSGLTESVLAEIKKALDTHELIKIKIQSDDRDYRKQSSEDICIKCAAELIQSIGKILVIYRKHPDKATRNTHPPT